MDKEALVKYLENRGIDENNKYLKRINEIEKEKLKEVSYSAINKKSGLKKYIDLDGAKEKLGVYIFYTEKGRKLEFLYIGECHTKNSNRDLKIRITQHFIAKNTGGLPYNLEKKGIYNAQNLIDKFDKDEVKITYIILEEEPREIILMESFLIAILEPTYNFFKIGGKVKEENI